MAKFKAAGSRKEKVKKSNLQAVPCLLLVVGGLVLVSMLFYALLSSAK